ncbi:MAG: hypothetical protein DWQ40_00315 [Actinobacteria bacterium]|nr:MAG: hypothetical protein DWQ40_00315 [Actinomycetota bacterium]REK35586.1 MAG: hypothetical protein DWQ20_06070 [Actinomycetota bacterium]
MSILDLQKQARRLGTLRFGMRVDGGRPTSLKHWRITSTSAGLLEAAAALWGGTVQPWGNGYELLTETAELPVMIPLQDPDVSWFKLWGQNRLRRVCDGRTIVGGDDLGESQEEKPCMCPANERACKPSTELSVYLPDIPEIGTWALYTGSWEAARHIGYQMQTIVPYMMQTGLIPQGALRLEERKPPKKPGEKFQRQFVVPVLELPGVSMRDVLEMGQPEAPALPSTSQTVSLPVPGSEEKWVSVVVDDSVDPDSLEIVSGANVTTFVNVATESQNELHAMLEAGDEDTGTNRAIHDRIRRLFELMEATGHDKWGEDGLRSAVVKYIDDTDGLEQAEGKHRGAVSSLRRKEHYQAFAVQAFAAAQKVVHDERPFT